jgi:GTPase SAR1 family protein
VSPKRGSTGEFSSKILAEALARRPLILIGDVGVGKTSFLKHLIQVSATEVFKDAISIYFDLGSKAALSATPKDALLDQIEIVIRKGLGANKADTSILDVIYKDDLSDFDTGLVGQLKDVDPPSFLRKRIELLEGLMSRREVHLRLVLSHLAEQDGRQVIFILDNADQRSPEIQSEAFLIAQELCASWDAMVFIALRPQTFHSSKRSGAVSAYPSKVFVIPPPKLEEAIDKRLAFAQKIAEGRIPVQGLEGVTLHLDSLALLIKCLRRSFHRNTELLEFLINISAGNIRLAVEIVARFFGNPNVQSEKIVRIESEGGEYLIPVHEFAKTALLGDYSHFQESSSVASNVFAIEFADPREHFLSLYILGYMTGASVVGGSGDGFVSVNELIDEMQKLGYRPEQIHAHMVRLTRKKLIEAAERRTLETDEDLRVHGMPDVFRATSLGAYVAKKWASEFSYLEAMSYDTPLMDAELRTDLAKTVNDDRLHSRYERARGFRDYLSAIWQQMESKQYFDWNNLVAASSDSFIRVEKRLAELGIAPV